MSVEINERLEQLRGQVRNLVETHVIPNESAMVTEDREGQSETLRSLQAIARERGLWAPHLPEVHGGLGLGVMGMCVLFREMGRSLLGPRVFNCDAPDQGNMDLLLKAGSDEIQARYLSPLCDGEITSAFCMTEPAPGAGADPSNLRTTAVADGDGWVIDGHKWFSTGGRDASFLIVMARTSEDRRTGASMFIVDREAEGVEHVRDVDVMCEPLLVHREAEMKFAKVRVGPEAVLGNIGEGFSLAQARLVPARLTHCMRWLGLADRTLHMCRAYVGERISFGRPLAQHQLIQKKFADNAVAIHAGNLMVFHCAGMLERGEAKAARPYSSMAKNHVAKLLNQVLDDAIQMHGALGYSADMPFAEWFRFARSARLADGPDEVHDVLVAREFLAGRVELLV